MRRRGITILEMLVATFIVAIAAGAVAKAFVSAMTFEGKFVKAVDVRNARSRFEDSMTGLLSGAELVGGTSYLVSPVTNGAGLQQAPEGGGLGPGSASLALTTTSEEMPARYLQATQDGSPGGAWDFESLNQRYGVVGGSSEVVLSTTPSGDAGNKRGLFFREQRPPDSDISQGGKERILDPAVRDIRFEFYDGSDWATSWDSRSTEKDKLPAAIRVTYLYGDDPTPHIFLVRLTLAGAKASSSDSGGGS